MKLKVFSAGSGVEWVVEAPAEGARLVVGRSHETDVVIDDPSVSRAHARILMRSGKLLVEDARSLGGTFVNGERVTRATPLSPGDVVKVGRSRLEVEGDKPSAALTETAQMPGVEKEQVPGAGAEPKPEAASADAPAKEEPAPPPEAARPASPTAFSEMFKDATILCTDEMMAMKSRIHNLVLAQIDPLGTNAGKAKDGALAAEAEACLDRVLREVSHELPDGVPHDSLRQALLDELVGYGPISPMLRKPEITEIMVNGPDRIFVECAGRLYETGVRFFSEQHLVQIIQRIVEPLGRHVDDASPMVDARLPDGSRVNAVVPPLALDGASMTIRKFAERKLTTDDLIRFGSMTKEMALFLEEAVKARKNILVSGGTGSGKTTLLNILSQFIPEGERIVTVEDSAELKLSHRNIVRLEARPANVEGKGRVTIRDLVINCLRMRPDRIIVGECRGPEALDMLQAMNTGHDGSLTTAHANNPRDALSRLENMVMMAGYDLPSSAIREQISSAIDLIVQQTRLPDGSRKIVKIVEVTGRENDVIQMQDIFEFRQSGIGEGGAVEGEYSATGNIPFFIEERRKSGTLGLDMSVFVPKV